MDLQSLTKAIENQLALIERMNKAMAFHTDFAQADRDENAVAQYERQRQRFLMELETMLTEFNQKVHHRADWMPMNKAA